MMTRRQWLALGFAIALLVLGAALLWRARPSSDSGMTIVQQQAERARAILASGEIIPIVQPDANSTTGTIDQPESTGRLDSIEQAFRRAPAGPPPEMEDYEIPAEASFRPWTPNPAQKDALIHIVTRWLQRMQKADPAEYAAWMRSRGYTLDPPEFAHQAYEAVIDGPPVESVTDEQLFASLFEYGLQVAEGQIRPVGISSAEGGIALRFLLARRPPSLVRFYMNADDLQQWVGGSGAAARRHWRPPVTLEEVIERHGSAETAVVSMGIKCAAGDLIPVNIIAFRVPNTENWHFHDIRISNAPGLRAVYEF